MLPTAPGHNATVLVALALIGGTPSAIRAGNVTSVPPPAMEFMTPPMSAETTARASLMVGNDADGMRRGVPVDCWRPRGIGAGEIIHGERSMSTTKAATAAKSGAAPGA